MATLLHLPDEVLLNVALRLGRNSRDLLHLALAHRRLHPITQEALVRSGCVLLNSIPKYIEMLEQNPGWANQIKHIEFKNDKPNANGDEGGFRPGEGPTRACERLICALPLDIPDRFRDLQLEWLLQSSSESWMLALLAILPHVTVLTIRSNDDGLIDSRYALLLDESHFGYRMSTVVNTKNELLRIGQGKIKTLNINMDKVSVRRDKVQSCLVNFKAINLDRFKSLTTCTITSAILSATYYRKPIITYPRHLKCLRITCDQETFPWPALHTIQTAMFWSKPAFQHLRSIAVFVDQSCRSFVDHMDESRRIPSEEGLWKVMSFKAFRKRVAEDHIDICKVIENWEKVWVPFETYFSDQDSADDGFNPSSYTKANLLQELRALEEKNGSGSAI